MTRQALQPLATWVEGTALQRCNRSAIPGVGVKTGTDSLRPGPTLHINTNAKNLCGWRPHLSTVGCHSLLANANRSRFQFPSNQHKSYYSDILAV